MNPRRATNPVKDENGDLLANPYIILNRWKNHFCQLLNAHGANNGKQREMYTAEPPASEPSCFKAENTTVS
jgi:hypothetical protein